MRLAAAICANSSLDTWPAPLRLEYDIVERFTGAAPTINRGPWLAIPVTISAGSSNAQLPVQQRDEVTLRRHTCAPSVADVLLHDLFEFRPRDMLR